MSVNSQADIQLFKYDNTFWGFKKFKLICLFRNVESYDYKSAALYNNSDKEKEDEIAACMDEPSSQEETAQSVASTLLDMETFGKQHYVPKPRRKRSVKDRLTEKNSLDMSLDDIVSERSININPPNTPGHNSVFDRLGVRENVKITEDSSEDDIIQHIIDTLQEENITLISK